MSGSLDVLVAEQQKKIDSLARRHVTTLQQRLAAVEATNEALAAFDDDMLQQVIDSGTYLVALNKEVQTQLIPDIFALLLRAEPLTALQKRLLKEQGARMRGASAANGMWHTTRCLAASSPTINLPCVVCSDLCVLAGGAAPSRHGAASAGDRRQVVSLFHRMACNWGG